ncbi:MAG: di-trans,poly-cis-decaprenylcistransferase [Candidatus Nanosynbacter sp.]|jgi:di-trans,poly-cis-decaprenylcistransferase|nr:di-trans,poly-cis-decaprenylcistransferase [Candidatus Nanosynbacter sp.]RYC74353.1 Trans,polycis-polyprenyl diphosphate synthase ((2Z,6E)-farnesyl diphosphate specific) [Candidatus Nanosynsacchari sp. TM7_G1_3_12Alb]
MSEKVLPVHVGFIVDGNRRWAKAQGLSAQEGHSAGYEKLREIIIDTIDRGVPYVSAYIFSTENWHRSGPEIKHLMDLVVQMLTRDLHIFVEHGIRLRVAGTRVRLSRRVKKAIDEAEAATKDLTHGTAILSFNYGGHQEIIDAVNTLRKTLSTHKKVTAQIFEQFLYTPDVPPCDLIVRTSGEQRLSNFMLWRSAYSELIFVKKSWPDMTKRDITAILNEYAKRSRRFGG